MSYLAPISTGVDAATEAGGVSSGKCCEQFSGHPFDLHRYRVVFPDRWSSFLRAHFRDHMHVAYVFGVSDRTSRNWWDGISAPRAEFALAACKNIPGAAAWLMEAA